MNLRKWYYQLRVSFSIIFFLLKKARRQLSGGGCMSDQESLASLPRGPVTPPASLMGGSSVGHGGGASGGCERGSCSADSGVRGSSDRESAAGNLSDGGRSECAGAASVSGGNAPSITVDPDSLSIVSSSCAPHMYQCEYFLKFYFFENILYLKCF